MLRGRCGKSPQAMTFQQLNWPAMSAQPNSFSPVIKAGPPSVCYRRPLGVGGSTGRRTRRVKARQGKARQGKARQGKARQGKARQGKARQGKEKKTHHHRCSSQSLFLSRGGSLDLICLHMQNTTTYSSRWICGIVDEGTSCIPALEGETAGRER
ncbi:hypothetical protein V8C34DRAFT_126880 [Trichoderma compactum]